MVSVKYQAASLLVFGLRRRAGRGFGFGSAALASMQLNVSRLAKSLYLCVHSWFGK